MRRTLLMIAAVALLLTQCRKPVVEYPTAEPTNENMVSMTVTVGHGRTLIGADGAITWSAGDKLYVGDGSKYIGCLELQSGAGSATGTFSGSVSTTSSTTFGLYYLGSKDYTSDLTAGTSTSVDIPFGTQTGLRENLSVCHIGYGTAKGKVEGTSVILDSTAPVTMTSKVAIAYFEFKKDDDSDYTEAITLSGTNIYNEMTVKFGGVEDGKFTGKEGTAGKSISLTNTSSSQKYVMLVPTGTGEETLNFGGAYEGTTKFYKGIEANKFYCLGEGDPIEVSVTPKPAPKFTVDASGTTVEFSPGNLQYIGSATTPYWKFAEHQWDYIGGTTGSGQWSATENVDRDLFGWGCTGYQDTRSNAHTYQTNYMPYSTSKTSASGTAATYNKYGYGLDYDETNKYGLSVENNSDWGCVTGLPSAGGARVGAH